MSEHLLSFYCEFESVPWRIEITVTAILKAMTFILQVLAIDLLNAAHGTYLRTGKSANMIFGSTPCFIGSHELLLV